MPTILAQRIKSHLDDMKKFLYYEGRAALLKRSKNSGIPTQGCSLSSLNFKEIFNEHISMGPLIETKYKPIDNTHQIIEEINLTEEKREIYRLKLEESKTALRLMLTPTNTNR